MPSTARAKRGARKGAASPRATVAAGAARRTRSVPAKAAAAARRPGAAAVRARKPRAAGSDFAFTTVLAERGPTGMWPHLFLSAEASAWLGRRGTVNVIVNVDGVSFRRTARPDGKGGHFIAFNADMRERSGVEPGDRLRVGLAMDRAPRAFETPRELEQALRSDPAARGAYAAMPASHRRAYVEFVEEAKRPETKVRRIQQALRMMAQWGEERPAGKKR